MPNLQSMSYDSLIALRDELELEIQKRRSIEEARLVSEFREKALALGLNPTEMASRLMGKKHAVVKPRLAGVYCNPNNSEQTWSGRGRKPLWVLAELGQGKSLDDLLIP